jgi:hypothetical protein
MARITEFIRVGLTPELLKEARAESQFQKISVNELLRTALDHYLRLLDKQRIDEAYAKDKPVKTRKA